MTEVLNDRQAWLASICATDCDTAEEKRARWADDAPRLVYADWLDENGNSERAEFIRVQCELHTIAPLGIAIPGHLVGRYDALRRRERELYERNRHLWEPSPSLFVPPPGRVWFTRGFIESIAGTAADWLTHADAITAEHPVREVHFTTPIHVIRYLGDWDVVPPRCIIYPNAQGAGKLFREVDMKKTRKLIRDIPFGNPLMDMIGPNLVLACLAVEWPGVKFHPAPSVRPAFSLGLNPIRGVV